MHQTLNSTPSPALILCLREQTEMPGLACLRVVRQKPPFTARTRTYANFGEVTDSVHLLYAFTPIKSLSLCPLPLSLESELRQRVASLWSQIRGGMRRKTRRWSREGAVDCGAVHRNYFTMS